VVRSHYNQDVCLSSAVKCTRKTWSLILTSLLNQIRWSYCYYYRDKRDRCTVTGSEAGSCSSSSIVVLWWWGFAGRHIECFPGAIGKLEEAPPSDQWGESRALGPAELPNNIASISVVALTATLLFGFLPSALHSTIVFFFVIFYSVHFPGYLMDKILRLVSVVDTVSRRRRHGIWTTIWGTPLWWWFSTETGQVFTSKYGPRAMSWSPKSSSSLRYHEVKKTEVPRIKIQFDIFVFSVSRFG